MRAAHFPKQVRSVSERLLFTPTQLEKAPSGLYYTVNELVSDINNVSSVSKATDRKVQLSWYFYISGQGGGKGLSPLAEDRATLRRALTQLATLFLSERKSDNNPSSLALFSSTTEYFSRTYSGSGN